MAPDSNDRTKYITPKEASHRIGLGAAYLRDPVRTNKLQAYHLRTSTGGAIPVKEDDVANLLQPGRPGMPPSRHPRTPDEVAASRAARRRRADPATATA